MSPDLIPINSIFVHSVFLLLYLPRIKFCILKRRSEEPSSRYSIFLLFHTGLQNNQRLVRSRYVIIGIRKSPSAHGQKLYPLHQEIQPFIDEKDKIFARTSSSVKLGVTKLDVTPGVNTGALVTLHNSSSSKFKSPDSAYDIRW